MAINASVGISAQIDRFCFDDKTAQAICYWNPPGLRLIPGQSLRGRENRFSAERMLDVAFEFAIINYGKG